MPDLFWLSDEQWAVSAAEDGAGGDVEGGKQRGRAVTCIIVAPALDLTGPHRQEGLGPVQRLNLGLFVDAQHQRPSGGLR
ncbi:hypothetical protein [Methylobacterium sp. J-076]|uniref:hypothetical protein n=1 Tax=Methylobacterium sp. J-076 TaxID=2836655 RepID=UPI00391D2609